ncbi:hypothetical protein P7K49_000982 [Saguinus oedipus]|uniref:Uncharacterized protein n=1 Tax=Saguinus oedipus TaxID=9490 RepID=A0ABQ9WDA6_SAGOE|nr:hypothetical protein P7K49_000982 [Saguinus oedipus]
MKMFQNVLREIFPFRGRSPLATPGQSPAANHAFIPCAAALPQATRGSDVHLGLQHWMSQQGLPR